MTGDIRKKCRQVSEGLKYTITQTIYDAENILSRAVSIDPYAGRQESQLEQVILN